MIKRLLPESRQIALLRSKAEAIRDACVPPEENDHNQWTIQRDDHHDHSIEMDQIINELNIHQIELELQNEELRQKQIALEKLERRYFKHYDLASVGLLLLDTNGWILDTNIIAAEMLGLKQRHAINRPFLFMSYVLPKWKTIFHDHFEKVLATNDKQSCELRIATRLGKEMDVLIQSFVYFNEQENKEIYVNLTNITEIKTLNSLLEEKNKLLHQRTEELERLNQQLVESKNVVEYLATHDVLTTLPNRVFFLQELNTSIDKKPVIPFAVFFIDLDNFKYINDSFGHDVGDLLLEHVADRLRKTLPAPHLVARLGGDEFIALVYETDEYHVRQLAQLVLKNLVKTLYLQGHELSISSSIGISRYPIDGKNANTLLKNADSAMYLAKHAGKNGICLFAADINTDMNDISFIKFTMKHAFIEQRFKLVFQPQIRLKTKEIVRFEALIRLYDPQGNLILPEKFITLAEDMGIITELTYWVLEEICQFLTRLRAQNQTLPEIALNLSMKCFSTPNFTNHIREILEKFALPPSLFTLEIQENLMFFAQPHLTQLLIDLKNYGFQLSLDDFGRGETSLTYIEQIPFTQIKLHESLIHTLQIHSKHRQMIAALIQYIHALGYAVVAEGIEHETQLKLLETFECDLGQGYILSPPASIHHLFDMEDDYSVSN